jgi:hypothetical protein
VGNGGKETGILARYFDSTMRERAVLEPVSKLPTHGTLLPAPPKFVDE